MIRLPLLFAVCVYRVERIARPCGVFWGCSAYIGSPACGILVARCVVNTFYRRDTMYEHVYFSTYIRPFER